MFKPIKKIEYMSIEEIEQEYGKERAEIEAKRRQPQPSDDGPINWRFVASSAESLARLALIEIAKKFFGG